MLVSPGLVQQSSEVRELMPTCNTIQRGLYSHITCVDTHVYFAASSGQSDVQNT